MNLVLLSSHSLDELELIAKDKFEQIPDRGLDCPLDEPDYSKRGYIDSINKLIKYVPINDIKELDIVFPLPSQWKKIKNYRVKVVSS